MHLTWDHDQRPAWQVHLGFHLGKADGDPAPRLRQTILQTGKARQVRVVVEDGEVAVSLRVKACSRSDAIPDAYHIVRVAARATPWPLLGEVRRADAFRWPPPVGGAS